MESKLAMYKREREKIYLSIGTHIARVLPETCANLCPERSEELGRVNGQIKYCYKRIAELKGLKACPECGTGCPPKAEYCNNCGASMRED